MFQNSKAKKKGQPINKYSLTTSTSDNYITPFIAWAYIKHLINTKRVWDPFYCEGKSGHDLQKLGFIVRHNDEDFFKTFPKTKKNAPMTICTNPPFSIFEDVLRELKKRGHPFIVIGTLGKLHSVYFRDIFKTGEVKVLLPPRRILFYNNNEK